MSQFDTSTTKETWYAQIEKNLARWKSLQDDQNGLKNMIQYLQETSVASKATAHLRDKHSKFVVLHRMMRFNIKQIDCTRRSFEHPESRTYQSYESSKAVCKGRSAVGCQ